MHTVSPVVASYALSMSELPHLSDEIERCVVNGRIDDRATPELNRIRKKIDVTGERIKQKLNSILSSPSFAGVIQEAVVTLRNGRYVIPVKENIREASRGMYWTCQQAAPPCLSSPQPSPGNRRSSIS